MPTVYLTILPPICFSIFKEQLSKFAWQYRDRREWFLGILDEAGRQGHKDAKLYAWALRAVPDWSGSKIKPLKVAIEKDDCEEAKRVRTIFAVEKERMKKVRKASVHE